MIEVGFSKSFQKAFKKRIQNTSSEERFYEKLEIFINDPYAQTLRTHKLSGNLKPYWSFSVEYDIRVIFDFIDENKVLFVDIGTHSQVY